jgi:hypothetical protein
MRWINGTTTFSDTTTKNQLAPATERGGRAFAFTAKARTGNTSAIYIGPDTTVSSTSGQELLAGDREDMSFDLASGAASVKTSAFYAIATSSGDILDWSMVVEN